MLKRQKIILFYLIFTSMHLHRETYFQSFDKKNWYLIIKRKKEQIYVSTKGKEKKIVIHLMYTHIYRQCTWVPSCANMCVVSCHRLQLIDCFLLGPKSDLFYCFLFFLRFFDIMFTDNFSFASFIDTTVHVMCTYTYIYSTYTDKVICRQ